MDWGSLSGFALLLTFAIFVLRILWCWLIILIVLGPPAYAAIVVGDLVAVLVRDIGAGVMAAVVVMGLLSTLAMRAAGAAMRWTAPGTRARA